MTSVPEITRLLAKIQDWQEEHGKPGGTRRSRPHKLFDDVVNVLTEVRRELLGSERQR